MATTTATVLRRILTAALLLAALAACSSGSDPAAGPSRTPPALPVTSPVPQSPAPAGLTGPYPCFTGFTCGTFSVPLDPARPQGPTLSLQTAIETAPAAPKGVLVFLNGGPGGASVPLADVLVQRLGPAVRDAYRIVLLDTRGTGPTPLRCPALQQWTGVQLTLPAAAVRSCATAIGAQRPLYGTDDVVADLEALRAALDVPAWTLFAVSYGTFVAQQYAARYPRRTSALALDSAFPPAGLDMLQTDSVRAVGPALRSACAARPGCSGDPAADLAAVVARDGGGADLLAAVEVLSSVDPTYASLIRALRAARRGDRDPLDSLLAELRTGNGSTAEVLSAAVGVSATCGDQRFPWGRADAPVAGRAAALRRAVDALPAGSVRPFDRSGLVRGGPAAECLAWPPTRPSRVARPVRGIPTLFVSGERDVAAPPAELRPVVRGDRAARLTVVPGVGHVVSAQSERGRRVLRAFLLGRPASG